MKTLIAICLMTMIAMLVLSGCCLQTGTPDYAQYRPFVPVLYDVDKEKWIERRDLLSEKEFIVGLAVELVGYEHSFVCYPGKILVHKGFFKYGKEPVSFEDDREYRWNITLKAIGTGSEIHEGWWEDLTNDD